MKISSKIIGCGSYLPEKAVFNKDLELLIDTTDEWIRTRTGIAKRHLAADDESTSDIALQCALSAIKDANISVNDLDAIIVCTTTPDYSFPSVATQLQKGLQISKPIPSFDIQAVCSGFIYGLEVANAMIFTSKYKNILLVAPEKMSALLNWNDRSTCVLFGDGGGAVVLQKTINSAGIIDTIIYSDGNHFDLLYTDGGVSTNGQSGKIKMQGPILFKHAVEKMISVAQEILDRNSLSINDISYVIPHQANIRIIDAIIEKMNIKKDSVIMTVTDHANCSAASIPLALSSAKHKFKSNDIILCMAFGAGLTWGASLIKW